MSPEIPEYYKHLAAIPDQKKTPQPDREKEPWKPPSGPGSAKSQPVPVKEVLVLGEEILYRADTFTLNLPEAWTDQTVFTLLGPATDGVRHNITITRQPGQTVDKLEDFAAWQIRSLEEELRSCRLLKEDRVELQNGLPAYRAVFVWWPTEELRLYQEQVYVLHNDTGYTLTASFSKKTRKTVGPRVEYAMLSFDPT